MIKEMSQNQMTKQHCEIKELHLQQTNERLRDELLNAKFAALQALVPTP